MSVRIDIRIEHWPIDRLIPKINNPRTHSREQVAAIAASIREFGWTNPVLVGADDGSQPPQIPVSSPASPQVAKYPGGEIGDAASVLHSIGWLFLLRKIDY